MPSVSFLLPIWFELAAEGDPQWVFFNGNYQEYEADKKKRLGEEAARPHRIKYKALK